MDTAAYAHGFTSTREMLAGAPFSVRQELRQATERRRATVEFGTDEYWILTGAATALNLKAA
jgi:hypothetical protein